MTKAFLMNALIEKMQSPDQDFRFMGLNDLMTEIKTDTTSFVGDEAVELRVLKQVLSLVEDKISEVKNQAVKCLGQLIKIIREAHMQLVIDKLIEYSGGSDAELRDVSGLALKTITSELPQDGKIAASVSGKLASELFTQVSNTETPAETLIETLSILSILITRFPAQLATSYSGPQPLTVLAPLLSHTRPILRKRAIVTIAQFVPSAPDGLFESLLKSDVHPHLVSTASLDKQRTTVQLVAAIARHSPAQLAPALEKIVPEVIKAAQRDDDELREGSLQALEALVLRCPVEVTPFLPSVVQAGNQFIKYDPNYAGAASDDEDEEMADADDDEDEDGDLDEYSDDEDASYKIRRSSTKLLAAIIGTRPEMLVSIYKDISPALISRFGDREETVKLEVWSTYVSLLNQTLFYSGGPQINKDESTGVKRKRDSEGMDVEETPATLLRSQVPSLSKALFAQIKSPKTAPATLQAAFNLLHVLLTVLPGCLSAEVASVTSTAKSILSQSPSTSTSSLHLTCLSFLTIFFATHSPPTFSSSLPTLTPLLTRSLRERHPRVAAESFRVFSALLNATKPVKAGSDWAEAVYDESVARLSNNETDTEVRARAEEVIADLWICATEVVKSKPRKEWEVICRSAGQTDGAVKVVTRVASEVSIGDDWVNGCVEWLMVLMRKSGRSGKTNVFGAIDVLLRSYEGGIPSDLPAALVPQIKNYVATTDIGLLSQSLNILALLLELSPSTTFPEVERDVLTDVYSVAHSPLVSGAALDSLLVFFDALVKADDQIASHIVPNLVTSGDRLAKTDSAPANVAKCVAQVVKSSHGIAAGTIAEFSKHLKKTSKAKPSHVVLSLLIIGELGRTIDMSLQGDVFTNTINHFGSEEEEIRTAASFASGNIAIGNLQQFLPVIVKMVETDQKKRLLSLHALKEVVTHCSHGQLEGVADTLWTPLFENSSISEEATRNVAAACLGKLATTHPSKYLPQLHARIRDEDPAIRATVLSAIRYTLADTARSYDELLAPLIIDFLGLIMDTDLTVRRLALSALNAAARTKPHLIREQMGTLLPILYKETVINPDLIRTVQMGPWTHRVDDGLEARKTAYETMYTLLDTLLPKIDLPAFLGRVIDGLVDEADEIKVITHMLLVRLAGVAPAAVAQRLDEATPALEKTMKGANVTKDTVKQDLERAAELQRSALRAVAALSKMISTHASLVGVAPKFETFAEDVRKTPATAVEFKELTGA